MKRKLHSVEEFHEYFRRIKESFLPSEEYVSPELDRNREYHRVERVDLRELPDKAVVFVRGVSFGADYKIRVDDTTEGRKVNIWRNMRANGLIGSLESVVSMVENLTFEEGVIIKGNSQLVMPYFKYKSGSVEKPTDMWMDVPLIILVQYADRK